MYSGSFIDGDHLEEVLKEDARTSPKGREAWLFGVRITKRKEIPPTKRTGPDRFVLSEQEVAVVEADQAHAKQLARFLLMRFNRAASNALQPGQYNLQFVPEKTYLKLGNSNVNQKSKKKNNNTLWDSVNRHISNNKKLNVIRCEETRELDTELELPSPLNATMSLRQLLLSLAWPLLNPVGNKSFLFHTVDWASRGKDKGRYVYLAYIDEGGREGTATSLVSILPEFIDHYANTKDDKRASMAWCTEPSGQTKVLWSFDANYKWNGKWTTPDDVEMEEINNEYMGYNIEVIDNLEKLDLDQSSERKMTADAKSLQSFDMKTVHSNDERSMLPPDSQQEKDDDLNSLASATSKASGGDGQEG